MKKLSLALVLLALVAGPRLGWAATATPTPNATLTQGIVNIQATQTAIAATATYIQTAYPTYTPTATPTGTLTPSATFTPGPKQLKSNYMQRDYFYPRALYQADGATALTSISTTGSTIPWLAGASAGLSQTCAVLSTGAAECRLSWIVPWNYKGNLKLYAYMNDTVIGDSISITVNTQVQGFNQTTQTAGTFSYTPPTGGFYNLAGTATQILAGIQPISPLWDTPVQVVSRVLMPLNAACLNYIWSNPPGGIYPGSFVQFDIKKSAGSGLIDIYALEAEYDYYDSFNP